MKTEKLKEWGLDERQIGMVMRENGLDIEAVKAKFSGYEALKGGSRSWKKRRHRPKRRRDGGKKQKKPRKTGGKSGKSVILRRPWGILCGKRGSQREGSARAAAGTGAVFGKGRHHQRAKRAAVGDPVRMRLFV